MSARKKNIRRLAFVLFLALILGMNISCGEQQGTKIQSKTNSPPVITSITISPNQPNKESELSLFVQSQNPDRDPVTFRYQWFKNEEEIPGENRDTLKSGNFKKGDFIRVKVTPSDGQAVGEPFLSGPVRILDIPPVVEEVNIEPRLAYANSSLRAVVKSSDPDGDSIHYLYRWEKSGIVLSGENTDILNQNQFKKGDSITVTVIPSDGEASGKPKKSDVTTIANSPPIIVSSPPTELNGNIYTYRVKAKDPDDESILFSLKTAPKGMMINKETGLIEWEVGKGDRGDHLIEIEATDPEGAKSFQKYTLSIQFKSY